MLANNLSFSSFSQEAKIYYLRVKDPSSEQHMWLDRCDTEMLFQSSYERYFSVT